MRVRRLIVVLAALTLVAAACGDDEGQDTTTTTTAAAIGTADNPIKVLFVPSVSAEEIVAGGEILEQQLNAATGLVFDVSVPTSYAATVEEMCASSATSMGFIPAQAYVLANNLCGVEVALKSIRFGYDVYWTEFLVQRDSDIQSLDELNGLSWGYPDAGSTSGFLVPRGMMQQTGIEAGEQVEAGGHTASVRAVYNGEVDFATAFYSPPTDPEGNVLWTAGQDPDVPADLVADCAANADGDIQCGDYIIEDARGNLAEEAPDVVQKVRILTLSPEIPNDTLSFGPDFPADVKQAIIDALFAYSESDPEGFETAFDAYDWTGVAATNDAEFDRIRAIVDALGLTVGDL